MGPAPLILAICAALQLLGTSGVPGATIQVRQDGTGNYTTIQAGVNAMAPGDTCVVGPGTYPERVRVPSGKSGQAGRLTAIVAQTQGTVDTLGFDTGANNYLLIQGFNISAPATQSGWDAGGIALRGNNLEIISNYVHDVYYGVYPANVSNVHLAGNRFYKPGKGIWIAGTGWLVERNEVERLIKYAAVDDADFCIFFGSNHVIRSNYWHGTFQSEIGTAHVDGFQTWDVNGEIAQHIRIDGNRITGFHHEGFMLQASAHTNSFDVLICNNIIQGSAAYGLAINQLQNVQVYNNTVADIPGSYGLGIGLGATGDIRNNIFYNVGQNFADPAGVTGAGNLVFKPGGLASVIFTGDLVNVDPKFVSETNGDFRLQAGSPAIDRGAALTNVTWDFAGVPRPQGSGWDIGAFEFVPASSRAQLQTPMKQNSNFTFTVVGQPGSNYSVEASTNLLNWSSVTSFTMVTGSTQFSQPMLAPRKFFRARLLP